MPTMTVKSRAEVPAPSRVSRAVRESQELYEGFIRTIGEDTGDLELGENEDIRSQKVRLRRASSRIGVGIDIWDANGHVYFKVAQQPRRRGRPRKSTT